MGCAQRLPVPEPVENAPDVDALAVVEAAAASLEPSIRARGLGLRVAQPDGDAWALRGLYDPDAYVQMVVIDALAERGSVAHLDEWLASARDPFARAAGAVVLGDRVSEDTRAALDQALSESDRWNRAPLALAATAAGVDGAEETLAAELRRGEIPLEPRFVRDLSRVGHEKILIDAMREGWERIEPELAPEWAAASLALGEPSHARQVFRDPSEDQQLAMLDALAATPSEAAGPILRGLGSTEMVGDYARCLRVADHGAPPRQLVRVATSELVEVRALAMDCAGRLPPERAGGLVERVLAAGLADESSVVQASAARAAQGRNMDTLAPALSVLAATEDPFLSLEAAGALLGSP